MKVFPNAKVSDVIFKKLTLLLKELAIDLQKNVVTARRLQEKSALVFCDS